MNRRAAIFGMSLVCIAVGAAQGTPAAPKDAGTNVCAALAHSYDYSSRIIASIQAEGVGDDSAPRETMRQLKELNQRQDQTVILDLMKMHNCAAPPYSAPVGYAGDALACQLEKAKANDQADICDITKWTALAVPKPAP